ncbi:MAG: hypothetical protein RLZZ618_3110 [Pseudomonadota bacterium]|jgi:hypothetical protein
MATTSRSTLHRAASASLTTWALACTLTAAAQPVQVGADAWATWDTMEHIITIHQPAPALPIRLRAPSTLRADLNADAGTLCGLDTDMVWLLDLASGQMLRHDLTDDGNVSRPKVVGTRGGACATPASDTALQLLGRTGRPVRVTLTLPPGMEAFGWKDLLYDDQTDRIIAIGRSGFAVIPASTPAASVAVKAVIGSVKKGTIEDTHFSGFLCCAVLSADGNTLYSTASVGDEDQSGHTAVVGVDLASARYQRLYIPFSPTWHTTGRSVSRFSKPRFELSGGSDAPLHAAKGSPYLYVHGFHELEGQETTRSLLRIHTGTGLVEPAPNIASSDVTGLSASGRWLLVQKDNDGTVVLDAVSGKAQSHHEGSVMAVAHARHPLSKRKASTGRPGTKPLAFKSDRIERLGLQGRLAELVGPWARRAPNFGAFKQTLMDVSLSVKDPATRARTSVGSGEILSHFHHAFVNRPGPASPRFDEKNAESSAAWQAFIQDCEAFSGTHAPDSGLMFAHCVLSPL